MESRLWHCLKERERAEKQGDGRRRRWRTVSVHIVSSFDLHAECPRDLLGNRYSAYRGQLPLPARSTHTKTHTHTPHTHTHSLSLSLSHTHTHTHTQHTHTQTQTHKHTHTQTHTHTVPSLCLLAEGKSHRERHIVDVQWFALDHKAELESTIASSHSPSVHAHSP
jgi:hypothetical protein